MVRGVLGFVVGVVLWMPAFFLDRVPRVARVAGVRVARAGVVRNGRLTRSSAPMSVVNATCWVVGGGVRGLGRRRGCRRPQAAWALAAVLAVYLGFLHLYLYWPNFPWWYNVAVAGLAAPAVLLGSKLARPARRRAPSLQFNKLPMTT